jgi:hypothetical protein
MSFAPNGRLLSPGEVYEAPAVPKTDEEWREDLNVTLMCPDCRENGMATVKPPYCMNISLTSGSELGLPTVLGCNHGVSANTDRVVI